MNIHGAPNISMNIYVAPKICRNMSGASNVCLNMYGASDICMTIYGASNIFMEPSLNYINMHGLFMAFITQKAGCRHMPHARS